MEYIEVCSTQEERPQEIEYGVDTIYYRKNIERVEIDNATRTNKIKAWHYFEASVEK